MAGLDGIQNKIHPGEAADKNLYDLPPEENAKIPTVCSSLEQALEALAADHEFLTAGGVFSEDLITSYIALKHEEVVRTQMAVTPEEYRGSISIRAVAQTSKRKKTSVLPEFVG